MTRNIFPLVEGEYSNCISWPLSQRVNTFILLLSDGHYGLYVGASLLEGTTHRCPTFDNEPLAKGEQVGDLVTFDCVGVEVWGVGG